MPVQSIECQLTMAQVKRYLAGADFPDDIVVSIERHLQACPRCMAEANQQRESLGGAPAPSAQAVVTTHSKPSPLKSIKALLSRGKSAPTPPQGLIAQRGAAPYPSDPIALIKTPKNLILSGGLAIVLVVMSTVLKNPSSVFGQRAADTIKANVETPAKIEPTQATPEQTIKQPKDEQSEVGPSNQTPHDEAHEAGAPVKVAKPIKQPVTRAKPEPKQPTVGGAVVVAEAPKTSISKPKPVAHTAPKVRKSSRPKAKSWKRPARIAKGHSTPHVRVYQPDGTLKKH